MKCLRYRTWVIAVGLVVWAHTGVAAVLYQQNFDTDTTSFSQTLSTYGFSNGGVGNAFVQSGMAMISPVNQQGSLDFGAFIGNVVVSFDTTIQGTAGYINVGLRVGDNNYIFHPGYPTGAFRIDGPDGHANLDMGFTPTAGLDHMSVAIDAASGMTTIRIVDGANAFQQSFLDANYASGFTVFGLSTGGSGVGVFDNLSVTAVPEPEIYAMMLSGFALLGFVARRRQRKEAA